MTKDESIPRDAFCIFDTVCMLSSPDTIGVHTVCVGGSNEEL